jgi:hypothetical protein
MVVLPCEVSSASRVGDVPPVRPVAPEEPDDWVEVLVVSAMT